MFFYNFRFLYQCHANIEKLYVKGYYKKQVIECVPIDSPDGSGEEDVRNTSKFTAPVTQIDYIPKVSKADVSTQN